MQVENYHFSMLNYDNVIDNVYFYHLLLLKLLPFEKNMSLLQAVKDNRPQSGLIFKRAITRVLVSIPSIIKTVVVLGRNFRYFLSAR